MNKSNNVLRIFICLLSLNLSYICVSQSDIDTLLEQDIPEMRVDIDFQAKYQRQLALLIRTYPMALKAKELIDDYNLDLEQIEKKRKQKKYGRKAHAELKDQFAFNIRDLYKSEGEILMKLVHRETGMTVSEIIGTYRSDFHAGFQSGLAKMWGNNLKSTYDPDGEDWITEFVIQDILSGKLEFDTEMRKITRAEYKESMRDYREKRRVSKKNVKALKKDQRKKEKKGKKKG